MSDLLNGLTRRINDHVFDADTREEMNYLIEEAAENCDDGDLLIELFLGEEHIDTESVGLTEGSGAIDTVIDDHVDSYDQDEEIDEEYVEGETYDEDEEDVYDEELEALEAEGKAGLAENATSFTSLKDFEVL